MRRIIGFLVLFVVSSPLRFSVESKEVIPEKDALDKWMTLLAEAESGGDPTLKILDTNRKYSYGCLQFQFHTFRQYARQYSLFEGLEDRDLRREIYNCESQIRLATQMIEEDYANWRHWRNTVKKIGMPPRRQGAAA
jgi:hypothetical protein